MYVCDCAGGRENNTTVLVGNTGRLELQELLELWDGVA